MANHHKVYPDAPLDIGRLQSLQDPLLLRVVKKKGNVEQPIELPPKENLPPGAGWTREEVLSLENWLLTKWSGGGYYRVTVIDARGSELVWTFLIDPRTYPERIPPNTTEAANMGANPPPPNQNGPQPVPSNSSPIGTAGPTNWPPSAPTLGYGTPPHSGQVLPFPSPMTAQVQQQQPAQNSNGWSNSGWPQPGWSPWQGPNSGWSYGQPYPQYPQQQQQQQQERRPREDGEYSRRERERYEFELREKEREKEREALARERTLEDKIRAAEAAQKESEHRAAVERQQQQHNQQMAALQEEMRRLGESRTQTEPDELRRAREEAQREREQRQVEQRESERRMFEANLVAQRQAFETQLTMLKDQLTRLAEPKGETDEIRRLREDQQRMQQENERRLETERFERERERERHEREKEREAQSRRDELLQREMATQRETMERKFNDAMLTNRPDPVVEMMKESTRMQADQTREIARMQQESSARMQSFMMSPHQMAEMIRSQNQGSDGLVKNVVDSLGGIVNMYRNAAEQVMQMSGGGGDPPAARLLQEGLGRAAEFGEKWVSMKRDAAIGESQVKKAQAQIDAERIKAQAQVQVAQVNAQARSQPGWAPPPPVANAPVNGSGLNGAATVAQPQPTNGQAANGAANGPAKKAPRPTTSQIAAQDAAPDDRPVSTASQVAAKDAAPEEVVAKTIPTEEQVFGPALPSVQRLRKSVADGNLDPAKAIDAILKGVEYVEQNQLQVPAFTLFDQERWADLIDVVLPEADAAFKLECVRILAEELEIGEPDEDEEADQPTV